MREGIRSLLMTFATDLQRPGVVVGRATLHVFAVHRSDPALGPANTNAHLLTRHGDARKSGTT